jgi:YVTN family beta-propeller protein
MSIYGSISIIRSRYRLIFVTSLIVVIIVSVLTLASKGVNAQTYTHLLTRHKIIAAGINVGIGPFAIDINTESRKAYVTNDISNTVSVINTDTDSIITNITVGRQPHHIGINEFTNVVYITNSGNNTVSVIDGSTDTVAANIPVGRKRHAQADIQNNQQ